MSLAAPPQPLSPRRSLRVLIVGAGFGGIAAAIELRRHGIEQITILERAGDLGGTWFYNSYPGAACDVPSHLYSFSFAQRSDWSRLCSPQAEIHAYLREVARAHGVDRLVRTNVKVTSCAWEERECAWTVRTQDGDTHEADALILATGQLSAPAVPRIEGAEEFAGHSFHSARWDHGYPLAGKRVAVIGTGASAVQIVPEIAPEVARLVVFQRTGNWFLPRLNRRYPAPLKAAFERLPFLQAFRRWFVYEYGESLTLAIRHPRTFGRIAAWRSASFMRSQLTDERLRERVWPDYTFGCKRVLFSSHFLPALQRANVELVTEPIERMTSEGIVSAGGRLHELDCVIWATGFRTSEFLHGIEILGREGASLHERWAGGAHAHLGMCVPDFPNMFVMYGPNTNTSGGSIIMYLEAQAGYIGQALDALAGRSMGAIEVRREVEEASDRALQARFAGTAWTQCDSWYRDEHGRIVANWPGYVREYVRDTARLELEQYRLRPLTDRALAGA